MSVESVREYFKTKNMDVSIKFFEDTSTVDKASQSLGVTPGEIAKSLLFKVKEDYIMVLMAGDKKIDNRKFKDTFFCKAKMPNPDEVMEITGHPVGGVCPFGLKNPINVYLDISLKDYDIVYPAAGEANAAVKLSVQKLAELTGGKWIDISN
ncbi:MAG: YbaK/EbsC family protein [Tepidanaerobacter acetatoxydans]|nr:MULTISPECIES: YbaK/EbsC family protein [Tepidanaerobacter]NLU09666.1 YbaK/EbsC family protein [Tepidanaerobacter acetatoxydans]